MERGPERRRVQVGGLRMYSRAWPAAAGAPAVVLLHGLGVSGRYLEPTARVLAGPCRVLVPDLPGFGESDRPRRPLDVPGLADALVSWLDAVGLASPALLANSLGCQVAVDCAARRPGRLSRLVLVGPTVDPEARTAPRQILRLAWAALYESPALWALVLRDYWACGPATLLATLRHALRDRPEEALPAVGVPALVVRGERDPICPPRWAEQVARLLPRGRLAVLARAGHAPHYSAPADLADLTLPFLLGGDNAVPARPEIPLAAPA
jgi:pimeloyl-ACP methyl ester carboxylesterase